MHTSSLFTYLHARAATLLGTLQNGSLRPSFVESRGRVQPDLIEVGVVRAMSLVSPRASLCELFSNDRGTTAGKGT